jgi:hypothetical protein
MEKVSTPVDRPCGRKRASKRTPAQTENVASRPSHHMAKGGRWFLIDGMKEVRDLRDAETTLAIIRERGSKGLHLEDVYRRLYNPDLYLSDRRQLPFP